MFHMMMMRIKGSSTLAAALCSCLVLFTVLGLATAANPYRFYNWNVTYGHISPLGFPQQGILINGQFPGPEINSVTNDNIIVNVFNHLDEPFLLSWNGINNRKNSFVDGVQGTTCPIPPGQNYTYHLQVKDQIGSFYYFPSLGFQKASGGFGGFRILSSPRVPVPFPHPADDFTLLIGDWYKSDHKALRKAADDGQQLPNPDAILINGRQNGTSLTVEHGKTYRLRISNVGLKNSFNFRIQGHVLKLVEVEGTHTIQTEYTSLDIHVGQSYSVLVTANQPPKDYYIAASSRFIQHPPEATAFLHYSNSSGGVSGPYPTGPTLRDDESLQQALSIRTNLTATGARPNPQGSYHYGEVNVTRTILLQSSDGKVNGTLRYAVNNVSFVAPDTPLKLADYFKIGGVFRVGSIPDKPTVGGIHEDASVMGAKFKAFVEIVFDNRGDSVESWHLDGHSFFVVGMATGEWSPNSRKQYNLHDAVYRSTVQVYPKGWTAVYLSLDNKGMWNLRSQIWEKQYLGEQLYVRVYADTNSTRYEYPIPHNALLCGKAKGNHTHPLTA